MPLFDDFLHAFFDTLQVFGGEGFRDVEVVVEPVVDGRTDAQLRAWEFLLHCLREHVGAGVADHGTSFRSVGGDGQEFCVRLGDMRQVFEVAFGVFDYDDGFRTGVGQVQLAHCRTHRGPGRDEKRVVRVCLGVGQLCHECALLTALGRCRHTWTQRKNQNG